MWYVQANPIAQTSSFEGDSIFNLLEQNGQNYGTGKYSIQNRMKKKECIAFGFSNC